MKKTLVLVLSLLLAGASLVAQTTMTATTTTAAITAVPLSQVIPVTSATNCVVGSLAVLDNEATLITSVSSLNLRVARGVNGTAAAAHASGTAITCGLPNLFASTHPGSGPCTSTAVVALPLFVLEGRGVSIYNCSGASSTTQQWARYTLNGYPAFSLGVGLGAAGVAPVYTSAGAITIMPGIQYIGSAGALAMTVANPTLLQNGMVMTLMASTAQAHTITYTAGFFGTTTSSDVCTLGGAIGDQLTIVANNLTWRPISTRNCTIA